MKHISNYQEARLHRIGDTWLEPEEAAYPNGGQTRKCGAICPDGVIRTVRCGIPDSYFSIPAHLTFRGRYIRGYVTSSESGFEFRVMNTHKALFDSLVSASDS